MRAIRTKWLVFLLLFFTNYTTASAQLDPAKALEKLYNDYPQEKIYVWLNNNNGYIAGESAWFKVYVFSGYDLSMISSNLYVEFLNPEKKIIKAKRLPLIKGTGFGSIELDSSLSEGVYYLRVYTDWMLNFEEKFQYIKPIPVYNPLSDFKLKLKDNSWTAAIFPEGGSLVEGLESKVVVRLFSSSALPDAWNGFVEEEGTGKKITALQPLDPNVAFFYLVPEAGKKYKVIVSDNSGKTQTIPVPEIKLQGANITTTYNGDSVFLQVKFKNLPGNGLGYSVIGHIQNQLVYQAKINSSNPVISNSIPTANYMNGILHLTLFDPKNKPVSERLVFLNPSKLIYDSTARIDFSFDPSPRSKNEINLTIDSSNWNSYALTILDGESPHDELQDNLLSSLWLTSDLGTTIHKPAEYFTAPGEKEIIALDALMISEKWIRFDWEKILNNVFPKINIIPQNFLTYSGIVASKKEIPDSTGVSLLLGNPGAPSQFVYTKTGKAGHIRIDNIILMEEFYSYYRLNNNKKFAGKKIDIVFKREDNNKPYHLPLPETNYILTQNIKTVEQPAWVNNKYTLLQNKKSADARYKILQEVIIKSRLKTDKDRLHDQLATGRFKISNENVFDFVNEKQGALASPTIFHWLQHKISGLEVIFSPSTAEWLPSYRRFSGTVPRNILYYLNEGETTASWLNYIPLDNIIMIKVIPYPRTMAFDQNIGLVISVYTERDSIVPAEREPGFKSSVLKGYDKSREYTLPEYDNKDFDFPGQDQRTELLWKPVLVPEDSLFQSTIKFFNNDTGRKVRVIIQGFDKNGFPVYFNKVITSEALKSF